MKSSLEVLKRILLVVVCVVFVLARVVPVSATELGKPISVAGECNCVKDKLLMSIQYSRIDRDTHMTYRTYRLECPHGSSTKVETGRENHSYSSADCGHIQGSREHQWYMSCVCGEGHLSSFFCMGEENGGNHPKP